MSKRQRLSWDRRQKKADPYTLHQDRPEVNHEEYMIGGPSEFGEDVHPHLPDDGALGRNEIGLTNIPESSWNHKDVDDWGSDDPYDNQRNASRRRQAALTRHLETKALQCLRIASAILPNAPEHLIEAQALDLMPLPDKAVSTTVARLQSLGKFAETAEDDLTDEEQEIESMLRQLIAESEECDEEEDEVEAALRRIAEDCDDEEEDKEEDKEDSTEATLRALVALLKRAKSEEEDADEKEAAKEEAKEEEAEEEEAEEADEKEASDSDEEDDAATEALVRQIISQLKKAKKSETEEEEADEKEASDAAEDDEDEKEASDSEDAEEDEEVEALIRNMIASSHAPSDEFETDFDVILEPTMDLVASDDTDDVLDQIFASSLNTEMRQDKTASHRKEAKRGVQSLGGRVKAAASNEEDVDLSKLWQSDPDVSNLF